MSKLLIPGILQQQANQQSSGGGGDWDYEGTYVVQNIFWGGIGWFDDNYAAPDPMPVQVTGFSETRFIFYDPGAGTFTVQSGGYPPTGVCNFISINGVEYDFQGLTRITTSNPFPAVGQICTIKLK